MGKTKCGCPYCKRGRSPQTRGEWKALKNRRGHPYDAHTKPTKTKRTKTR